MKNRGSQFKNLGAQLLIHDGNKVVVHPASVQKRLECAIELFDSTTWANDLLQEFLALADVGCMEAYYFIGCIFEDGGGDISPDMRKVLGYYQKSVDEFGYLEGYLALAKCYYYGVGVTVDYQKSFYYYSIVSSDGENPIAHMMLGRIYQFGLGKDIDLMQAKKHFEKAVTSGNVYALRDLGVLEQAKGNWLKGWNLRLKAGFSTILIASKNRPDSRLRPA